MRPRSSALALVGMVLIAGCSGRIGDSCRTGADCGGGLYCQGPSEPTRCGIGPRQECASDADCSGQVCHAAYDTCSPNGIGSQCGPPCTDVCFDGLRCNAARACEPIPCDEGFACAVYQGCDSTAAHASAAVYNHTHGCVSIPCASDDACPVGTKCTNEVCQEGAGTCREATPVP